MQYLQRYLITCQALLYTKPNQPVMTITIPNGFRIGPSTTEIRGVSKCPLAVNNPVVHFFSKHTLFEICCFVTFCTIEQHRTERQVVGRRDPVHHRQLLQHQRARRHSEGHERVQREHLHTGKYHLTLTHYRVAMVVGDMGWVDLDLGCSAIFPSYPANSAKPPSA